MTITLDTLLADFEAARQAILENGTDFTCGSADEWLRWLSNHDRVARHWQPQVNESLYRTAVYIIDRDHGLNAAMLYKLSDGAIDPRNPPS